jgi:hypothetical protein
MYAACISLSRTPLLEVIMHFPYKQAPAFPSHPPLPILCVCIHMCECVYACTCLCVYVRLCVSVCVRTYVRTL